MSQRERVIKKAKKIAIEYCDNTSIHGLKYCSREGSHWVTRVAWFLIFLGGIGFSSYFCVKMWKQWTESPVLTTIDSNRFSLLNMSFPTITICSVNKASKNKLQNYTRADNSKFNKIGYEEIQETLAFMTDIDKNLNQSAELERLSKKFHSLNISSFDLFKLLENTAPSCQEMIKDCKWLGSNQTCMDYFSFVPTDDGMCCSFNSAKYTDEELKIFAEYHDPLVIKGNGYRMGLSLIMDADVDDYSVTTGKFDGFKVLVHNFGEFADVEDRGFVLGPGTETFAAIKGSTSFSTDGVAKKVSTSKRGCRVDGEHKLRLNRRYSHSGCVMECITSAMVKQCKCRPYYLIAFNETKLCDLESYQCIAEIYEDIKMNSDKLCDCLPSCTDSWYVPEISYAPFPGTMFDRTIVFKNLTINDKKYSNLSYYKKNMAALNVYFKEMAGTRYKTDIRYGVDDFISSMGGLLGLGLGLSFVSVVEIFYFFCLRWCIRAGKRAEDEKLEDVGELLPLNK